MMDAHKKKRNVNCFVNKESLNFDSLKIKEKKKERNRQKYQTIFTGHA